MKTATLKQINCTLTLVEEQEISHALSTMGIVVSFDRPSALINLSAREREILEGLAKGYLYKEIASQLFISPETVRKHVSNIYVKLNVGNRTEAINKYYNR